MAPDPTNERWDIALEHAFRRARIRQRETSLAAIERVTGATSRLELDEKRRIGIDGPSVATEVRAARFLVTAEISRDSKSIIFEARDRDLGRAVVLKRLTRAGLKDGDVAGRFFVEAQIGGQLQHPGVPAVYGLGIGDDDCPFLALRPPVGETLADLLERRERPALDRIGILEQVCQTLAYAHARGVTHTNLSTDCVTIGEHGEVFVANWENARVGDDPRTDVLAVGTLMDALLEPGFDESLEQLARSCAASDPSDRPRDARPVAEAIAARLSEREERARGAELEAVKARALSEAERMREENARRQELRERRSRLRAIAVSVLLLTAVLLGGAHLLLREAEDTRAAEQARAPYAMAREEAAQWEGAGDLARAIGWAEKARALAGSLGTEPEADDLLARLRNRERLTREDDAALLALDGLRIRSLVAPMDPSERDRDYQEAFVGLGIDLTANSTEEAALSLRARPRLSDLTSALDAWAKFRLDHPNQPGTDGSVILAAVRAADPDEWRQRLRDHMEQADAGELLELASSTALDALPVRTVNLLARLLEDTGQVTAAIQLLEQSRRHHPEDAVLLFELGVALLRTESPDADGAIACQRAALALCPEATYLWSALGLALEKGGEEGEALYCYQRALDLRPENAQAHFNLGNHHRQQGRLEEALVEYRRAAELDPESSDYQQFVGIVLGGLGRVPESERAIRDAVERNRENAAAWTNLGVILHRQGKIPEAIEAYRAALECKPDEITAWKNLGTALNRPGTREEALTCMLKAHELDPDARFLNFNLGLQFLQMNRPEDSISYLVRSVELRPKWLPARHMLGHAQNLIGDFRAAIETYRGILEIAAENTPALNNLAQLLCNCPDPLLRDYPEALRLAEAAANDSKPLFLGTLSMAQYRMGLYQEAIDTARKAESLRDKPVAYDWLLIAAAQARLGQRDRARENFARAVDWLGKNEHWAAADRFRAEVEALLGEKGK